MNKIEEIRDLTCLTQVEFSERYNIPLSTIRKWEQEQRKCPDYVLQLLEFKVKYDEKMLD